MICGVGLALTLGAAGEAGAILPPGIRILTPAQVLADRTRHNPDGALYFQDDQGTGRRFLTSIDDPAITNRGDGSFHPASMDFVENAIESIDPRFLGLLRFETCILPFPVADPAGSWADEGAIYLSPGVYAPAARNIHFLISHEAGHLAHRALLPDADHAGWARYRALRRITDAARFNAFAAHRDRPHEIFAEDFRILFGSDEARLAGGIENADLPDPREVPGLRDFFLGLIASAERDMARVAPPGVICYPNPLTRGDVLHFGFPGAHGAVDFTLFDVSGRRVRTIRNALPDAGGISETPWDGRDDAGRALSRGVYYATIRGADDATATPAGAASAHLTIRLIR